MCICSCPYNHKHRQLFSHLWSVSPHSQRISFLHCLRNLPYLRQRWALQLSPSLDSVISKIIERGVKSRLIDHLNSNELLNPHQSAYCKHQSTETTLLYIHDHLISAIGLLKVSCFCLLDFSAAFDSIDHNILITRLSSWFGIHGSVLSWFKSYLSSRSFRVKCENNLSSFSLMVFPKALFLALYSSSSTLPFTVLVLSLPFPLTTTFMQMILSCSFSTQSTLTQTFLTFKSLFNKSFPGWFLIFLLWKEWILAQRTQKQTCQNIQIFTWQLPLCSKFWLHLWRTSYFLWLNYISLQSLLLSHSSASLYPALPRFVSCL